MFKTYIEVRDWLESFIPQVYGKEELGLARIEELLNRLGNPQDIFISIHVAGTSGKGSTCFYIARLLERVKESKGARGVKVGLHVSPHLSYIGERMQINGEPIPVKKLIKLIELIKPVVEEIRGSTPNLAPSYFEILVAASFLYFAQEKVDWAVVEVGLGGRLDATNVLRPEVSVITNIGLDHTEILGETVEEIAFEKAGIIKGAKGTKVSKGNTGTPVVTGATGAALEVIRKVAKEKGSKVVVCHPELGSGSIKWIPDQVRNDILRHCTKETALLAIKAVEVALSRREDQRAERARMTKQRLPRSFHSLAMSGEVIQQAFSVGFPGRFEEMQSGVILDGAHNPDKVRALIEFIKKRPGARDQGPVVLVLAFKKGKKWKEMMDMLFEELQISPTSPKRLRGAGNFQFSVKEVIATEFNAVTDTEKFAAVPAEEITRYASRVHSAKCIVIRNSQEAVWEALMTSDQRPVTSLVLVTGSLYLVGEVRPMWDLPGI